tara:strand:+ start:1792 stop:2295 length:504 start_codon:yes stop_codon:yes gene_type:complete
MKNKVVLALLLYSFTSYQYVYAEASEEASALSDSASPLGLEPLMEEVEESALRRRNQPKRDKRQEFKRETNSAMLGLIDIVSVRDLLMYRDNHYGMRKVMLNGVFTRSLARTEYEFKDSTGMISVFYNKDIALINYSMETEAVVTIYGTVDVTAFPRSIQMIDIKIN